MNLLIITEKSAKFKEQMGVWKETFKRINCWLKPSYLKNSNNIISSSVVFILLMKVWEYRKDWWPFTNGWFSLQRNHRRLLCNNTRYKTQYFCTFYLFLAGDLRNFFFRVEQKVHRIQRSIYIFYLANHH